MSQLREEPARFFSTLSSLNSFDKMEIRNVIRGLISPAQREICFTANYHRASANVESILAGSLIEPATRPCVDLPFAT
jgi:hypothetical protein